MDGWGEYEVVEALCGSWKVEGMGFYVCRVGGRCCSVHGAAPASGQSKDAMGKLRCAAGEGLGALCQSKGVLHPSGC